MWKQQKPVISAPRIASTQGWGESSVQEVGGGWWVMDGVACNCSRCSLCVSLCLSSIPPHPSLLYRVSDIPHPSLLSVSCCDMLQCFAFSFLSSPPFPPHCPSIHTPRSSKPWNGYIPIQKTQSHWEWWVGMSFCSSSMAPSRQVGG
jgi:hypothetical protein